MSHMIRRMLPGFVFLSTVLAGSSCTPTEQTLDAPVALVALQGPGWVKLSWQSSEGAVSYDVEATPLRDVERWKLLRSVSETSVVIDADPTDSNFSPLGNYRIRVKALSPTFTPSPPSNVVESRPCTDLFCVERAEPATDSEVVAIAPFGTSALVVEQLLGAGPLRLRTSRDGGLTWSTASIAGGVTADALLQAPEVLYAKGRLVVGAMPVLVSTDDGGTFAKIDVPSGYSVNALWHDGSYFRLVLSFNAQRTLWTSEDAVSWNSEPCDSCAYNVVASGDRLVGLEQSQEKWWVSTARADAPTVWTRSGEVGALNNTAWTGGVAVLGGTFLAWASSASLTDLVRSTDGLNFAPVLSVPAGVRIHAANGRFYSYGLLAGWSQSNEGTTFSPLKMYADIPHWKKVGERYVAAANKQIFSARSL